MKQTVQQINKAIEQYFNNELSSSEVRKAVYKSIETQTKDHLEDIKFLLEQKEAIERQIKIKSESLRAERYSILDEAELALKSQVALTQQQEELFYRLKVGSQDILPILGEIFESSLISVLEQGENIESTVHEVSKQLTFEVLESGVIFSDRIRHMMKAMLKVSIEVAEACPNQAQELLRGTVFGIKDGINKAVQAFKQKGQFADEELLKGAQKTYEELHHLPELFVQTVKIIAKEYEGLSENILLNIVDSIHPELEELIQSVTETINNLKEKLVHVLETISHKAEQVKIGNIDTKYITETKKAAVNAKVIGNRAFKAATSVIKGAIEGAKSALEKEEEKERKDD